MQWNYHYERQKTQGSYIRQHIHSHQTRCAVYFCRKDCGSEKCSRQSLIYFRFLCSNSPAAYLLEDSLKFPENKDEDMWIQRAYTCRNIEENGISCWYWLQNFIIQQMIILQYAKKKIENRKNPIKAVSTSDLKIPCFISMQQYMHFGTTHLWIML